MSRWGPIARTLRRPGERHAIDALLEGEWWVIFWFGLELGKAMAVQLAPALSDVQAPDLAGQDSSTAALVRQYRQMRGRPT